MRSLSPLFSVLLAPLTALSPVMAQLPDPGASGDPLRPPSLQLRVLGDDKTAPAGFRSSQGIAVEVSDAAGIRVADATVVFHLPDSGPSATFADGSRSAVTYTDSNGRAHVTDIHWGNIPGSVNVRITAAKGTTHAGLLFTETLTASSGSQDIAVPQVAASKAPALVPEPPASPERQPTPDILGEGKPSPGVTVEHFSPHSRISAGDNAPSQAATIPASAALADDSPDANVPVRHMVTSGADEVEAPKVSISSAGSASKSGHSKTKWIIAIAAAAAAGAATLAMAHSSGGSSASSSGVTIGSPTVSVGHP
ncbi:MAG: hypothetical protein JO210_05915 [Acidobacteriaceae bacterium]|nr:hypothetical protein [Acidobacteriaceae bacterium]